MRIALETSPSKPIMKLFQLHVCQLEQKNLMNWEFIGFFHSAVSQPSLFDERQTRAEELKLANALASLDHCEMQA
jgi:hypothetical protein